MKSVALCPHCQAKISYDDRLAGKVASCPGCQGKLTLPAPTTAGQDDLSAVDDIPLESPIDVTVVEAQVIEPGDATGGVIPYKNLPALIAYYCAVFSLVPCLGLAVGVPAVILGVIGLRKRRANPAIRGAAHAWIGIILGGLTTLLWGGLIILILAGAIVGRGR